MLVHLVSPSDCPLPCWLVQRRTGALLAAEGLGLAAVVLIALLAFPFHLRTTVVGVVAVVITIGMYCAPLDKMVGAFIYSCQICELSPARHQT